ncbi:hypothetical protein NOR53_341 [gamma proteobacterium NOR5-3]|nr:hypothetical protein NOR53_341 [gamma proteobacterium NOR5-3]
MNPAKISHFIAKQPIPAYLVLLNFLTGLKTALRFCDIAKERLPIL